MIRQKVSVRFWALTALLFLGFAATFYFLVGRTTQTSIIDQFMAREQVLARSEASNLHAFFDVFGESLAVLGQAGSIRSRNEATIRDMDVFTQQWKKTQFIGGILLTGPKGTVRFNSNVLSTHDTGAIIADRDYFTWARDEATVGAVFVGKPVISRLGASRGQTIIPVATPVYDKGQFQGVLATSVELQPLTQHYLGLMNVSPSTEVYLLDTQGTFLYASPDDSVLGTNALEQLQQHSFLGSQPILDHLQAALAHPQEGKIQAGYFNQNANGLGIRLLVYTPVSVGNQTWLLVMAAPIQEALALVPTLYWQSAAVFGLGVLLILILGILIARNTQKTLSKES